MIRFSRMADYGVVVMTALARSGDMAPMPASDLAHATRLPQPTVSQVAKRLTQAGLLVSVRGPAGGYGLGRPPSEINVAEIISALDGPILLADCLEGPAGVCDLEAVCQVRAPWRQVSLAVRRSLEAVSLANMLEPVTAGSAADDEHHDGPVAVGGASRAGVHGDARAAG
ncbi:MAG: Rrf2 family transcriptional regulator [Alphaproteobacteria bacterium]